MTDIVHYFDNNDKETLIDIYVDKKILATLQPDEFLFFFPEHPLIYEAVHHNIFSNKY